MFENNTDEFILKSMMDKIPIELDKREGSIIYNALAPAAQEMAKMYSDMDRFLSYAFASPDIPDKYLDLICSGNGIKRKSATYAIKLGIFMNSEGDLIDIPLNSRFSIDKITYVAIEKSDIGKYKMQSEVIGTNGNNPVGDLLPIEYIENLATAKLSDLIYEAVDMEDNESVFNRLMTKIQTPATSGNKYHYLNWALEVTGVGSAKVFPLSNGAGTVKVVIVDSNKHGATQELIKEVFDHIEEVRPIGATATVVSAKEKVINITANISLVQGYNLGVVQQKFSKLLEEYLQSVSFKVDYISIAKIGNILLNTTGVLDYTELKINNSICNILLKDEEIAILGSVMLGVM